MYMALGYYTALRISDLLKITWEQLDKDHLELVEKKTGKVRRIPVHHNLKRIAKKVRKKRTGYILDFKARQANNIIKRIVKDAGYNFPHISTHSFRKTFGRHVLNNMDNKGEGLILLMDLFNHTSLQTTKRYLGIMQDDMDNVYKSLPDFNFSKK